MCNAFWETFLGTGNQVLPSLGTRSSPFICEKRLHMKYLYDLIVFTCNIMNDLKIMQPRESAGIIVCGLFTRKASEEEELGLQKMAAFPGWVRQQRQDIVSTGPVLKCT